MKALIILFSLIMFIDLASAVPQVIFSDVNITIWGNITSGNNSIGGYQIIGEGVNAVTTFPIVGNCSFNYARATVPLTFSRDLVQNDTDIAILINSLAINNNITYQWQQCVTNLSTCLNDVGYKGNYTLATAELDTCYRNRDSLSTQIKTNNEIINQLTTWRNLGVGAGLIGIGLAIYFYRKQSIRKITDQYKTLSPVAKQY